MTIFASPAILAQSTSLPISINVNGVNLVYETYGPEDGKPKGLTKETIKRVKEKLKTNPDPLKEMMLREPNISSQLLATITVPVLITGGSKDVIKPQHLTFIAASLKHGELLIFQDESHSSYIYRKSLMTDALLFFMAENGYR